MIQDYSKNYKKYYTNSECFAYSLTGEEEKPLFKCLALNSTDCRNCKFFKTKEEYKKGLRKLRGVSYE